MPKCCGKISYRDEIAAKLALATAINGRSSSREERRIYRCERGRWHLTHKRKGGRDRV